jgi:GNAT superfamily N-acetyltransferase
MLIRTAGAEDVDVVCGLRFEFMAGFRGGRADEFDPEFQEATRVFVRRSLAGGTLLTWLAEEARTAVGLVSVVLQEVPPRSDDIRTLEGLVVNMYVRSSHCRQGIGRLLLDACLRAAPEHGLRRLNLYATSDGRPLYAGRGFVIRDNWMVLDVPADR